MFVHILADLFLFFVSMPRCPLMSDMNAGGVTILIALYNYRSRNTEYYKEMLCTKKCTPSCKFSRRLLLPDTDLPDEDQLKQVATELVHMKRFVHNVVCYVVTGEGAERKALRLEV